MLLGQSVGSEAGPQFKGLEHWGCSLAQEYRQLLTFIYCAHPSYNTFNSTRRKLHCSQVLLRFAALLSLGGTLPQAAELLPSQGCAPLWVVPKQMLLIVPPPTALQLL